MAEKPAFFKNWIILRRFKKLKRRVDRLTANTDRIAEKAEKTEKQILEKQVDHELAHTYADELKKYHTGARLQPISHLSVKDINNRSYNQIANMRGIGPKSATAIKKCAQVYTQELRDNQQLRISDQNRTPDASELVKSIYQFDKLNEINEESYALKESAFGDDSLEKSARIAAHPILWLFSKKKEASLESIQEIDKVLRSNLITEIEFLEEKRSKILKAQHDDYWKAFIEDPARFYSVLEDAKAKKSGKKRNSKEYAYLDTLAPELQKQIDQVEIKTDGLKCILRPYQRIGVKYILHQRNVLLGDEMGLGKTIEAIATIVSLRNNGYTHFAVICPASVLINWEREIKKHSDLSCYVLHGPGFSENIIKWESSGGVAITNFESTSRFITEKPITLTVVDEAHYIKNYGTIRTINTYRILKQSNRRLLMSGTPLENKLEEMIALINLIQPEIVKKIYSLPQPINRESYKQVIAPVYFRRTKDAVWREMPALQVVEDVVELTSEERQLYIECINERTISAFAKMRQISFEVENINHSSKLNRIKDICEEAIANGRKVIIFSFYLNTISKVKEKLGKNVYGPITGSIPPAKRQEIIDDFSKHENGAVLLSQILAGGTGLNIQKASIVIICEPQYKPSIENQAVARVYRIGQTSNVTVYRLLCSKTVDERILEIIKEKQALFDAYADKSVSGEKSLQIKESELANAEFENCLVS